MLKDCHINVYKTLRTYINTHGHSPSVRDLRNLCSYKSTSTVYSHLKRLEKAGYIEMEKKIGRSMKVV